MSNSSFVPLDTLAQLVTDKISVHKDPRLPYVGLEHIAQGEPMLLGTAPSASSSSVNGMFRSGDVLFGKLRPNLRKCVQIPFDGYCSTDILILRPKPGVNRRFAAWVFQQGSVFDEAIRTAEGTKMPRTSWERLKEHRVFVPEQTRQARIADALDATEAAIQQTEALIAKLKQMYSGLIDDLLTFGLDERGQLRAQVAHPEQFKETPIGRIPMDWSVPTIGELASHVGSGITPTGGSKVYQDSGVVLVRSQNVTFEGLRLDDVAHISMRIHEQMQRSEIFANDVLINITGASIGRCCPVPPTLGMANVNQHVCAIRLPEATSEDATFLSAVLSSHIGQSQIDRLNAGSNREGLNYQQLRSFRVPWPSTDERARIATIITEHAKRTSAEEAYRDKLKLLKQGLMDDLLTGRVHVRVAKEAAV